MIDRILSVLFPKQCLSCGAFGAYFCTMCIPKIQMTEQTICPVCTRLSPYGMTHPGCRKKFSIDGLYAPFRYIGGMRKGIKRIKFNRVRDIVPEIAALTVQQIENPALQKFLNTKPVLIPVPLHPVRKRKRWFNQSELLAEELGKQLGLSLKTDVLQRIKNTTPQSELHKSERLKNIKNAFSLSPVNNKQLAMNNVLLIDDVWTTGSTMREAGNVLKRGGVKHVWALTVAR